MEGTPGRMPTQRVARWVWWGRVRLGPQLDDGSPPPSLSAAQIASLGDALRTRLEAHGRWAGQMAHLRGDEYPTDPAER